MNKLSPREREVAEAIHSGIPRRELALQMGISSGTLQTYVGSIFKRLGIHTEKELVLIVERAKNATVTK